MENYPVEEWSSQIEQKLGAFDAGIETGLRQRYGRAFKVVRRKINPEMGLVTLYASPADDPDLVFRVNVTEGAGAKDDYVAFLRLREYALELTGGLSRAGVEATVEAVIPDIGETTGLPADTALAQLLGREGVDGMLVRVALKGPVEDLSAAVAALKASGLQLGAPVVFTVYVFGEDGYEACRHAMQELPSTSDAVIRSFEPAARFALVTEDGTSRITEAHGIELEGGDGNGR